MHGMKPTGQSCTGRQWLLLLGSLVAQTAVTVAQDVRAKETLSSDSEAPYVHRLTLYDHDGTVIDPTDDFAGPYSPKMTCGKCHPYAEISGGWHFNAGAHDEDDGRPGEPWFLRGEPSGIATPITARDWPGTLRPADVGITPWNFVMRFGHHYPGGGYAEPSDDAIAQSDQSVRWDISGTLEIDCMFCHSADQQHDPAEAARQIAKENFKWAPTAALGLAVIRGEARKVPDDWDPMMPPDPDSPETAAPALLWDLSRFDADGRVWFNVTRRPSADRCYFCHSSREVGAQARLTHITSEDVHMRSGMTCVDCHRNGINHMITRGYPGESKMLGSEDLAMYSCAGCHLGWPAARSPESELGGAYGAPRPTHAGLPPLHFERLTCTACHSGPWPQEKAAQFQTAMAHELGIASRERNDSTPPTILGPVFGYDADGRIAPERFVDTTLSLHKPDIPGMEFPYRWAIAHDVRPASQALGVNGCTDCHSLGAPLYFGEVECDAAKSELGRPQLHMYELRDDDPVLARAWSVGFLFRPAFKLFGFACAAIIGLVLLRYVLDAVGALARRPQ